MNKQGEIAVKAFSARVWVWMLVFVAVATGAWFGAPGALQGKADAATGTTAATSLATVTVRDFAPVDVRQGWLWAGDALYWTGDAGKTWVSVSLPGAEADWALAAVHFGDAQAGWAVLLDAAGGAVLAATPDRGATWRTQPLPGPLWRSCPAWGRCTWRAQGKEAARCCG